MGEGRLKSGISVSDEFVGDVDGAIIDGERESGIGFWGLRPRYTPLGVESGVSVVVDFGFLSNSTEEVYDRDVGEASGGLLSA